MRGQNVSVLHLCETPPLEFCPKTRQAAPINSFKIDSSSFANGESLRQHSLESYLTDSHGTGKSSKVCALNSDAFRSVNCESSPVLMCERGVDDIYIGKSGWVQTQKKSSDDSRETFRGQNGVASTLRSRKLSSNFNSNGNSVERREQNRPINLSLSSRKLANLENHKTPYAFTQELEAVSPPSVTPILSPPPAFRDEKRDIEIFAHPVRKPFYLEDCIRWKSRPVSDSEGSTATSSLIAEPYGSASSPVSASKHQSRLRLQTKSLDEKTQERTSRNGRFVSGAPLTLFAFRSLDNCHPVTNNDRNLISKSFHALEEEAKVTDQEDSEIDEGELINCSTKHSTAFQTSSRERLTSARDAPITRRQRRLQLSGKRAIVNDISYANRVRSPSLDSNSSNSSSSSDGSSVGCRSQKMSSRRLSAKQCHPEDNHFTGGVNKRFNVKRSRSLQFSEERLPHELNLMSQSSSGKSWDQVFSDRDRFRANNDKNSDCSPYFRDLHNVVVEVNGQGIPIISKGSQSLNLLNEITASEEEQLKLIQEAAREARVIAEFLSGTKSRAAARSLIMHRYFNRPEAPTAAFKGDVLPKPQSHSRFLRSSGSLASPSISFKDPYSYSFSQDTRQHAGTKQLTPSIHSNATTSLKNHHPLRGSSNPSKNHAENLLLTLRSDFKENDHDQQTFLKTSSLPRPEKPPASTSIQRQGSNTMRNRSACKFQNPPTGAAVTTDVENVTKVPRTVDATIDPQEQFLPFDVLLQNSPTSSSSADTSQHHFNKVTANAHQASISDLSLDSLCLHSKSFVSDDDPSNRHILYPRPASAPEAEDYDSVPLHHRSLSLPRSFPSDQYIQNYFARRRSGPRRRHQSTAPNVCLGECSGKPATSAILPITPVSPSRHNRSMKTSSCSKSSLQYKAQGHAAATASFSHKGIRLRSLVPTHDDGDYYDNGNHRGICRNADSSESQGSTFRRTDTLGLASRDEVNTSTTCDIKDHRPDLRPIRASQTLWAPLGRSKKGQFRRSLSLGELPAGGTQSLSRPECRALSEDENNPVEGNSDYELSSDSESSERNQSLDSAPKEEDVFVEAVWDNVGFEPLELSFRAGDVIEVLDTSDRHWWWGARGQKSGYFPSSFVRLSVSPPDPVLPLGLKASNNFRRSKSNILSSESIRANVIRELINTERDFVNILRGVKEGYMNQCSQCPDMFTSSQINTIFGNLDDILIFQEEFLKDLEKRIDEEFPHKSCVGEVFLNHSSGFRMYSEYCNFHPMAMAALQELYRKDKYRKFFEMCRLKQNLSEIPLDGYLLTPVQRICKYPLQLAELLKYTKPDHPDFGKVEKALRTMKSVATLINERKRKMERLEKLAAWQCRVEGWEGDDLIELSSQLIYQGDVVRITSGMWTTNVTLFLFDHQIIYCRKDLLKRHNYIYKGRICLDDCEVLDLTDGKNQQLGVTIKYGIRISNNSKEAWLVFCCRSSEDKEKWLRALAEEKRLVALDKEMGLDLPPSAKQLAKIRATATKKIPPNKPRGKNKVDSSPEKTSAVRDGRLNSLKVKGGRRMGTWFTFGGVMKSPKVSLRHRASFQQTT